MTNTRTVLVVAATLTIAALVYLTIRAVSRAVVTATLTSVREGARQ